jgi:glucokinase
MYLGVDIGGTRLKAGLVSGQGQVGEVLTCATPEALEPMRFALRQLVRDALGGHEVTGVGFGCKGIVDPRTTRVDRLPGIWQYLEGTRLRDLLDEIIPAGTPVAADNDAKAALAGEVAFGAAKGKRNVMLLTLGTGIGGAILCDGHLLRGASGVAGHLGHVTVDPDGPPCICGSHGCLEAVFSARAIEAEAWSATHQGAVSPLTEEIRRDPAGLSCRAVFEHAARGDEIAGWIVKRRLRALGAAVAGLMHAVDPEVVILTGQIAEAGDALFAPLRRDVWKRTRGLIRRKVPIVPGGVADTSGVTGAAALALL